MHAVTCLQEYRIVGIGELCVGTIRFFVSAAATVDRVGRAWRHSQDALRICSGPPACSRSETGSTTAIPATSACTPQLYNHASYSRWRSPGAAGCEVLGSVEDAGSCGPG